MSWSLEFVLYYESQLGVAAATFSGSQIFDLEFDPQSITGIDYFKQEIRFCKLSLFANTWLTENITTFVNGIGNQMSNKRFFSYVARITYLGNPEYMGYLSMDKIFYDEESNIYNFIFVDIYGIIRSQYNVGQHTVFLSENVREALIYVLNQITLKTVISPGNNVNLIDNYDLVSGITANNLEIYNKETDTQLEEKLNLLNYYNFPELVFANFNWQLPQLYEYSDFLDMISNLGSNGGTGYLPKRNIISILELNGVRTVSFMFEFFEIERVSEYRYYVYQLMIHKTITITNDIELEQNIYSYAHPYYGLVDDDILYDLWHDDSFYNNYITSGYPAISNYDFSIDDDYYELLENGNVLKYSGVMNILTINWEYTKTTLGQELEFLLLLNNLSLNVLNNGDIEIINKTNEYNTIVISTDDIVKHTFSGLLRSSVDYASSVGLVVESMQSNIAFALGQYYNNLFATIFNVHEFEILNNYTILLTDIIQINDIGYKVISIHLDNERFIYTIKAWRI